MLRTPFDGLQLLAPGGAVPDLQMVIHAGHDDVPAELRVPQDRRRHHAPPLRVGLELRRRREEVALHHAVDAAERVERAEPALDELAPLLARVDVEAAVHAAGDEAAARKGLPEPGWKGEAVLLIDRMVELTEEH